MWNISLFLIPIAVASALFMELMDSAALATALPTLSRIFHVAPFHLKIALTAYLVTVAVLVPASSWFSCRLGMKKTFMLAMAIFIAGSVCCGLSNSFAQLVGARILQGMGGSMMLPVGRSIIVATSPRAHLVKALSWFTLPAIAGPLMGPPLAGALLEYANWRWIFLINVPIGLCGLLVVAMIVPGSPGLKPGRFDWTGFLLAAVTILIVMVEIETAGLAGHSYALRLLAVLVAITAGYLFCRHARNADAIVDLRLLKHRSLSISLVAGWFQRFPLGATPYLLPLLLQMALRLSPLVAGQIMSAMAIGSIAARFMLPPILRRLGFRTAGILLAAFSAAMSGVPAFFGFSTSIQLMMIVLALSSLARGLFFLLVQALAYLDLENDEVGHVSVMFTVAQQISYSMGVELGAWLLLLSSDGDMTNVNAFRMPFIVIALLGALSALAFILLRRDAGEVARGLPPDQGARINAR